MKLLRSPIWKQKNKFINIDKVKLRTARGKNIAERGFDPPTFEL